MGPGAAGVGVNGMAKRDRRGSSGGTRRQARPGRERLRVLFEDDDLIVVDKPCGLATAAPGPNPPPTLFEQVKGHVRRGGQGRTRVSVVHRLDAGVSGLVIFAKSPRAFAWLKEDLRARRVQRNYLAVVEGVVGSGSDAEERGGAPVIGSVRSMLVETASGEVRVVSDTTRSVRQRGGRERPLEADEPRDAVTHYRVLHASGTHSLLQVRLETGRKHQIRVHLASIGHPVAGDAQYGARTDPVGRICLHAAEISFSHPGSGQRVRLTSPAPRQFWTLCGASAPPQHEEPDAPEPRPVSRASRGDRGWDEVAQWYDDLVEHRRNDLHTEVVIPGALRLLDVRSGERVLDVACGQGVLTRAVAELGALAWGVDASPQLIELAKRRCGRGPRLAVADARALDAAPRGFWPEQPFDAAACVMALMNIEPVSTVFTGVAAMLRPGGRFVAVMLHPAFRSPGRTSWGWGEEEGRAVQYRRVDSYLSPGRREIVMNPGKAARGARPVTTPTYHRPLQTYVQHLSAAGLLLEALEEWPSPRQSEPGPRAAAEDHARREIPMFLGLRAIKTELAGSGEGER